MAMIMPCRCPNSLLLSLVVILSHLSFTVDCAFVSTTQKQIYATNRKKLPLQRLAKRTTKTTTVLDNNQPPPKKENTFLAFIRPYGTIGIASYILIELMYWTMVPAFGYYSTSADTVANLNLSDFWEACKAPFLVAMLLWPNTWIRNGLAVKLASILTTITTNDGSEETF